MIDADELYSSYFGFPPREHQRRVFEVLGTGSCPLLLRAPCASGKTEAVAAPFLSQFVEQRWPLAPRLIYVLPTQALCNQLACRLAKYARKVSDKLVTEVHHGGHPADAWFMADIVVTTLDQFVYGYARATKHVGRHLEAPAGSIANSFVVFDEAHLYQSGFTFSVLRAMIEILAAARVPFVLMTATLPTSLAQDLSEHVPFTEVTASEDAAPGRSLALDLRLNRPLCGQEGLDPEAAEKLKAARSALVVCNQVRTSQQVYRALKQLGVAPLHLVHSRFTTADRKAHEEAVCALLAKDGPGGVVVSTQVCEAGLNVSADLLVTELAPADSLIQRAGRCARFGGKGRALAFGPSKYPYEAEHLTPTAEYLTNQPTLDLTSFASTSAFADCVPYRVADVAAADSLYDLYEATLYAGERPHQLTVREGKCVFAWVGESQEVEQSPEGFTDRLLSLDYGVACGLLRAGVFATKPKTTRPLRLEWDVEKGQWGEGDMGELLPGGLYRLNPNYYSSEEGVIANGPAGSAE